MYRYREIHFRNPNANQRGNVDNAAKLDRGLKILLVIIAVIGVILLFGLGAPGGEGGRLLENNFNRDQHTHLASTAIFCNLPQSLDWRTKLCIRDTKVEYHNNTKGVLMPIPAELGSTNVQENSMMSSGTSPEAASFQQLQLVMEQLDLRTKLCIRDSHSEQRHNHANLNGDERDATGAVMAEGTKNFMDMETDTDPIDRSIAHSLCHRPSESSAVQGSITSPPIVEENMAICDETAFQLEKDMNC